MGNPEFYNDNNAINPNFIEQLRPLIFGLSADDGKTSFKANDRGTASGDEKIVWKKGNCVY